MKREKERMFYKWKDLNKMDVIAVCVGFFVILLGLFLLLGVDLENLVLLLILILVILLIARISRGEIFDLKSKK